MKPREYEYKKRHLAGYEECLQRLTEIITRSLLRRERLLINYTLCTD